jgi:hypothetical protein
MNKDYKKATELGLTSRDRWEEGADHHPMSERLMRFLSDHDHHDYQGYFDWEMGGDGDNGETLAFQMDAFFELLENVEGMHPSRRNQAQGGRLTSGCIPRLVGLCDF